MGLYQLIAGFSKMTMCHVSSQTPAITNSLLQLLLSIRAQPGSEAEVEIGHKQERAPIYCGSLPSRGSTLAEYCDSSPRLYVYKFILSPPPLSLSLTLTLTLTLHDS
jgi:hypothetical protein